MGNEQQQYFVVSGEVLQQVLNNLSEQKLKDGLNLYMAIQQSVKPLEQFMAESSGEKVPEVEDE